MSKTLNFDKFMSEKVKEYITVTIFGKEYQVLSAIPATVPVMMARAETVMDGEAQVKLVMQAADTMLGADTVDELCKLGMSAKELSALVQKLFLSINGAEDEDEESQELSDDSGKVPVAGKKPKK